MDEVKSRNLSVAGYFEVVQKEYLIADFKRKIYYNVKDKQYYQKVMSFKADKINNIAERNNLNSVLNDKLTRDKVHSELFDAKGNPTFRMTESDFVNYYLAGSEFSYLGKVWILKNQIDFRTFKLYCEITGETF